MPIMVVLEYVAFFFGVLCVFWTVRQSILCWPAGLIMVSLYLIIFGKERLYSDMILQAIYIPLQIYGWWYWTHGDKDRPQPPVTRLTKNELADWILAATVATLLLGQLMSRTDAAFPYGDAFTTSASLVAQWLMGRKKLENWVFWIAVDLVAVPIYFSKGLYPTTVMYLIFLGLATSGLISWWKSYAKPAPLVQDA